jgi:acyl carrier protein
MADVQDTIVNIIAQKAKVDPTMLSRETGIRDIDIDSLDVVEIFFEIEEAFDISIPYNANEAKSAGNSNFHTVGDVVDIVTKLIRDGGKS